MVSGEVPGVFLLSPDFRPSNHAVPMSLDDAAEIATWGSDPMLTRPLDVQYVKTVIRILGQKGMRFIADDHGSR